MRILITSILAIFLLAFTGCSKDDDDDGIQAGFSWQLTANPGEVAFTNTSNNADVYEWNFGDGDGSTAPNPTHVYDDNGEYIVTLKAFGEGTASVNDTVLVDNIP